MQYPPLVRVRELVNKLAEPRLPLLMQAFDHSTACPAASCRACHAECPTKVSGMKLVMWVVGDLQIFVLSLQTGQKICFCRLPYNCQDIYVLPLFLVLNSPGTNLAKM